MNDGMRIPDPSWVEGDPIARGLVPEPPDNYLPREDEETLEGLSNVADKAIEELEDVADGLEVTFGDDAHWYAPDEIAEYLDDAKAGIRLAILALKRLEDKSGDLIDNGERMDDDE